MINNRFSGTLKLSITYNAQSKSYAAHITEMNNDATFRPIRSVKLAPIHNRLHPESPEALDLAAEAILGFASNSDDSIVNFAEFLSVDSDKFKVTRKP